MKTSALSAFVVVTSLTLVGCGESTDIDIDLSGAESLSEKNGLPGRGHRLFHEETFGGNGRTCATCHANATGGITPAEVQARFAANPNDPLFLHDGSDDGQGNGVSRILAHATVLVTIPLPANVTLVNTPSVREVTLARAIPDLTNTAPIDPKLMLDGRHDSLEEQALSAIVGHAQVDPETVATDDLVAIAEFEREHPNFFSSPELRRYARGGDAPVLPEGNTESEKRGRRFFDAGQACGTCHFGPMLNETSPGDPFGNPVGERFLGAFVSQTNLPGNPVKAYRCVNPNGTAVNVTTADPGVMLITGVCNHANRFRNPTLWGVKHTAPYFHDNSAATLRDTLVQYNILFGRLLNNTGGRVDFRLDEQEMDDIIAYLQLL